MHDVDLSSSIQSQSSQAFELALRRMLQATAGRLGEDFIQQLVKGLCVTLSLDVAIIARFPQNTSSQLQTVAVFADGQPQDNFQFELSESLCKVVIQQKKYWVEQHAQAQFPRDVILLEYPADGALGVVLSDSANRVIGVLLGLSYRPLVDNSLANSVLEVFAFRVAAELERQTMNQNLRNEVTINQTQIDSVPALMFMLDRQGRFLRWNHYFKSKFGYTPEQIKNQPWIMTINETDRKRITLEIEAVFERGSGSVYINGVTSDGQLVPLLATVEATTYQDRPVIVGVALDMSEQQVVERNLLRSQGRLARKNSQLSLINVLVDKLHTSHSVKHIAEQVVQLLQTIQSNTCIGFSAVNLDGHGLELMATSGISQSLAAYCKTCSLGQEGYPSTIAIAANRLVLFPSLKDDERIDPELKQAFIKEGIVGGLTLPLIYKGEVLGSMTIGYKYHADILPDEVEFYQTIGSSISLALANARQYQIMENLATQDTLTELPNRNAFNRDCPKALAAIANSDLLLGIMLIDLDRFKEINDTLDHQIGDKLLRLLGPRIATAANDPDTQVYRLGGDEFCLLVKHKKSPQDIERIATAVGAAIAQPFDVDGLNLEISSSIGVVSARSREYTAGEMLRCAELAMYHAKNEGGGIAQYSPDLDADTNQRFVIMAEMAEAIRNDELVLHFQPKFDLKTRTIIGSEALVRWQHKKYGLLPPAKFIPQVELTQLINPLTYWVMKTAFSQLKQWQQQGLDISVAINLSTRNLNDDDFIHQVDQLLERYQINPRNLEFEVTETTLMNNLERAKQQLSAFSQRGIQCSLDDYGTGYASLTYIKKLPLDIIKIDRSFISQMLQDKDDKIIAKSTINLAHRLGMKVIAEGVEDVHTLEELALQGCDFIQGFFISQPVSAERFTELYWQHSTPQAFSIEHNEAAQSGSGDQPASDSN